MPKKGFSRRVRKRILRRAVTPKQKEALEAMSKAMIYPAFEKVDGQWRAVWRIAHGGDNEWIDDYMRSAVVTPLYRDAENQPHLTLHDAWLSALKSETGLVKWHNEDECIKFSNVLAQWYDGVSKAPSETSLKFKFSTTKKGFYLSCSKPKDKSILASLGRATFVCGILRSLRVKGDNLVADLSHDEAENFLSSGARDLVGAGYLVEGCDIGADIDCSGEIISSETQNAKSTQELKLTVRVAGRPVTLNEIKFLLDQGSSLVFFKDRWIEVDRSILRAAYRVLEKKSKAKLSRSEALRLAFGFGRVSGIEVGQFKTTGWVRGLVGRLKNSRSGPLEPPKMQGFTGALRDYQYRAVVWMKFLTDNSFGALLADDMGLGKTVQTIAWMASNPARPYLVVAPLTLLQNWRHEIAKFAPNMKTLIHHGSSRLPGASMADVVKKVDVVITSYSLIVRDFESFSSIKWAGIILDEAQAIKNPDTRVSNAVRNLYAVRRVALTGTPVENSALDIWGIEEFLNKGFLGPRKDFEKKFIKTFHDDYNRGKLRHALEPFILRRLKTDENIAPELGSKHIVKEYCELTNVEKREYENVLAEYRVSNKTKGDALALITKLKLVCDGKAKLERLFELLDEIFASGESALIFSQYVKVGAFIKQELDKRFGRSFQFLNGSLSASEREKRIEAFKSSTNPEAFILSLKAGGYGLTLTKATHVIHFDRWWNPAVENQATDRAHRIGQVKPVFVHCMITSGTIEERVDEILESKKILASGIVTGGESYLMQLKSDELLRLSELS